MTEQNETRYDVTIRNTSGDIMGEGVSKRGETWNKAAERIARKAGLCHGQTNSMRAHTYFPTAAGSPIGTHHVQFGYRIGTTRQMSLGRTYVVQVAVHPDHGPTSDTRLTEGVTID